MKLEELCTVATLVLLFLPGCAAVETCADGQGMRNDGVCAPLADDDDSTSGDDDDSTSDDDDDSASGDDDALAGESLCDDGLDNDSDGYVDCDDQDCWGSPACPPGDDDDSASGDDDDTSGDDDTSSDDDDASAGPDEDGDGYVASSAGGTDCNDSDPTVSPAGIEFCDGIDNDCNDGVDEDPVDGSTWHLDSDSDGYGGQLLTQQACEAPPSYVNNADDCNDLDGAIYPGATELCNGIDDDCDGALDDDAPAAQTWYLDNDGDGVGGLWLTQESCSTPLGYSATSDDCDDTNATIYPGATEVCDGSDNDCDGNLGGDEVDDDGDGVTECSQDCDDSDPLRFPGSVELCDGIDNDCDVATTAGGGETDGDGDQALNCEDCDDDPVTGPAVYPGAAEVCDGLDNDCDGTVDVGATNESTWYLDADNDNHGGGWLTQQGCSAPTGYVANANDCNDLDPNSYPGAPELCDGQDNDCNGQVDDGSGAAGSSWYADSDADGYGDPGTVSTACSQPTGFVSNNLDCDDGNPATNPTSYEICDGIDNNCAGGTDEAGALNATLWYVDADGDGYGGLGTPVSSCTEPSGYADNDDDCNDDVTNGGPAIHPAASEICNTIDDDCDGTVDDGAVDATIWYVDADGDGYGNVSTGSLSCTPLGGTVQNATDCNDTESSVHPAATEVCDGVDNDCDGDTDVTGEVLGSAAICGAVSCLEIRDDRIDSPGDGVYWLDPEGSGAFQAYCDMTVDGGGWTLVARIAQASNQAHYDTSAVGLSSVGVELNNATTQKFADSRINAIRSNSPYSGSTGYRMSCWEGQSFVQTMYCSSNCTFNAQDSVNSGQCARCAGSFEGTLVQFSPNHGTRGLGHHHDNSYPWSMAYQRHPEHGDNAGCKNDARGSGSGHLWIK